MWQDRAASYPPDAPNPPCNRVKFKSVPFSFIPTFVLIKLSCMLHLELDKLYHALLITEQYSEKCLFAAYKLPHERMYFSLFFSRIGCEFHNSSSSCKSLSLSFLSSKRHSSADFQSLSSGRLIQRSRHALRLVPAIVFAKRPGE